MNEAPLDFGGWGTLLVLEVESYSRARHLECHAPVICLEITLYKSSSSNIEGRPNWAGVHCRHTYVRCVHKDGPIQYILVFNESRIFIVINAVFSPWQSDSAGKWPCPVDTPTLRVAFNLGPFSSFCLSPAADCGINIDLTTGHVVGGEFASVDLN